MCAPVDADLVTVHGLQACQNLRQISGACPIMRRYPSRRDIWNNSGWTVAVCPSAPAVADPYILADEAIRLIVGIPPAVHAQAYDEALADWREEAFDTFSHLVQHGIQLRIVSNTDTSSFTAA
jgi:hypothetical protein